MIRVRFLRSATLLAAGLCLGAGAQAQRWERLGPPGGEVLTLAAAKDSSVYLGTPDGHIFASADRGTHWELRGRAGARLDGVVQALIADAQSPERLYAAVWYQNPSAGGGVFRSEDGGRSWEAAGLKGEAVRAIEQDPAAPNVLVAGTSSGVFRSANAGKSWQRISLAGDPELRNIDSVAVDPRNADVIYAGTYHLPWKTEDGGKSWRAIAAGMIDDSDVMGLRIDMENPARIFASACSGIYRSEDGGAAWVKLQGIPYSSRRTQEIFQNPVNPRALYAATTEGLWATSDRGENWTRITPREWVVNSVVALPERCGEQRILIGTETQGVLASDDGGRTFYPANGGFAHRVLAAFAADPRSAGHLLVLAAGPRKQLLETQDAGRNWDFLPGGSPRGGVEHLFGGESGWWAALESGGAALYDGNAHQWRSVRFLMPRARRSGRAKRKDHRVPLLARPPHVLRIVEAGEAVYAATTEGLWSGEVRGYAVHRVDEKSLRGPVRDLMLGERVCALAAGELTCLKDNGKTGEIQQAPARAGQLLWVEQPGGEDPGPMFVGARNGVFALEPSSRDGWRLLQSGLPAVASVRVTASGGKLGLATETGGFYVSSDEGKSWIRVDGDGETGDVIGLAPDGRGGFIVGSRAEGVLHWDSGDRGR